MNFHSLSYKKKFLSLTLASLFISGWVTMHEVQAAASLAEDAPVDFAARSVEYDDLNQKVTALGDVEIVQNERIVKADKVVYDLKAETVSAEGNVALLEKNGDVHFADKLNLEKTMKSGYVKKLRSVLADGSRFTAEEGQKIDADHIVMKNATYTPCEPCKLHPEKPPVWDIKADKVVHDSEKHTITYHDATFEVKGVPVMYVPYFSHADGTIKQKSGFLPPTFALNSDLGFSATPRYYWGIDETQDATIGVRTFLENNPLVEGDYRKRFDNGKMELSGSGTRSDRTDRTAGMDEHIDDEWRGSLFGKGLWDIDDKWRAGFNAAVVSDDQYLRQYNISSHSEDDVLENEIYAERFSDRNYAVIRGLAFQDTRISNRAVDQPSILPEAIASFLGQPGETLGGRWSLDVSALGLTRDGDGQDVLRGSAKGGWERKDIFDIGLVNTISANLRGDAYSIPSRDEDLLGSGEGDSVAKRFYPYLQNTTSYPLVDQLNTDLQAIVEPTVSLMLAPRVKNSTDIPNEDSQDVQLDVNNFFEANRFPGLDRVEDDSNVTYGVRTGLHSADGSKGEVFLGQSYRFNEADNPFPSGSGLDTQSSDYVGEITASYVDMFNLNYRFELSSDDWTPERHELDADATFGKLGLSTSYFYSNSLAGTDLTADREQLYGGVNYAFTEEWRSSVSARYDLSEEAQGLRSAALAIEYLGQCFTVTSSVVKNFTFESTGDNATEFTVRLGLKNLGEFGSGS